MDEIRRLKGELPGIKKKILFYDDFEGCVRKASYIKQILFDLRVVIYHLMEQTKKKPTPQVVRMLTMGVVNVLQIEIPTFDGNILNWRLFWEQLQAAVNDKPQLGDFGELKYCGMYLNMCLPRM